MILGTALRRIALVSFLSLPLSACTGDDGGDDTPAAGAGGGGGASGKGGTGGSGAAGKGGTGGASGAAGSGMGGAGSGGGPEAAAIAACKAFCAAEEDCNASTTLAQCEETECVNPANPSQALADTPADCRDAATSWWTCLSLASNPCNRDSCPTDDIASACF